MKHGKPLCIAIVTLLLVAGVLTAGYCASGVMIEDTTSEKAVNIEKTVSYLKERKPGVPLDRIKVIASSVYEESKKYDLDYRLVLAIMKVESNYKNEAVSRTGRGLMQINPRSARALARQSGVELKGTKCLHEPEKNIKLGVSYLSKLHSMFDNIVSALHAYNAGPGRVQKPENEQKAKTTAFTRKVMSEYQRIAEILPDPEE